MPDLSPKYLLADTLLEGKFRDFVEARRGEGRAWRHIAADLYAATDQKVDVTSETLRQWFPEDRDEPETKAS